MIHIHEAVFKTLLGNIALLVGCPFLTVFGLDAIIAVSKAYWLVDVLIPILIPFGPGCWFLALLVGGTFPTITAESVLRSMIAVYERPPTVYVLLKYKTDIECLLFGPDPEERIYNRSL